MEEKNKWSGVAGNIKLTKGEKLLIWRRRKRWNQPKAAKYHKLSLFKYKLCEYDVDENNFDFEIDSILPYEKCLIYRKRSGETQLQIAKKIGIGREWVRLQEKGKVPCEKLLKFWENV